MLNGLLKGTAVELPTFVCVLFVGVVLRNGLSVLGAYRVFEREVSVLGNVSLSLFLAIALIFITFRVMGSNYDAAVLAAGHCGFGLGATPTAIANMQAVTQRYGPSHIAFLVVPMVGAFFIDIINVIVIKVYLALPFFTAL